MTFSLLVDDAAPSNLPAASNPAAGYTAQDLAGTGYERWREGLCHRGRDVFGEHG